MSVLLVSKAIIAQARRPSTSASPAQFAHLEVPVRPTSWTLATGLTGGTLKRSSALLGQRWQQQTVPLLLNTLARLRPKEHMPSYSLLMLPELVWQDMIAVSYQLMVSSILACASSVSTLLMRLDSVLALRVSNTPTALKMP
jgi:hypothetical protein